MVLSPSPRSLRALSLAIHSLLEQMVHKMVAEDRRDAEKNERCKREGYRVVEYYE